MSKIIVRIKESDLAKMFEKSLASKSKEEVVVDEKSMATSPKIKLFLSKEAIAFLEEIMDNVDGDSPEEIAVIDEIKHGLTDCLVNT